MAVTKKSKTAAAKKAEQSLEKLEQQVAGTKKADEIVVPDHLKNDTGAKKLTKQEHDERLLLLQKMLFRKVPISAIAVQFGISTRMVHKLKDELKERTLQEVSKISFPVFVGETMEFFEEARGMALIIASDNKVSDKRIKLNAIGVALRAEEEKHKFLALCGVYKSPTAQQYANSILTLQQQITDGGDKPVDPMEVMTRLAKSLLTMSPQDAKVIDVEPEESPELSDVQTGEATE